MSVRTADTNAPRVSWNMGLSLLEGQSRPITWDQLQIVDNDNLRAVRIITVDGLQHGRLTLRGGKGFMFTIDDIRAGAVRYHHDDSDTTKDFVVFRITDGRHQTRHKFPINILPKDDSPPFLTTNMLLELSEGQTALLRGAVLQASDMDSSDDYILYNITRPPQAGEIMKLPGPGLTGFPVHRFLQKDLFHSVVYYRHLGGEVFHDSFEVVLSDFHDPPNLSEPQVILVHINPVPDQPPKEVPGVSRCLVVKETEVVHLTKKQLHFVDVESPDSELTFTVTSPPFYTGSSRNPDAGRLFLVDSVPKFTKDSNAPVLRLFTQHAVNFLKVAYMPPALDIGPYAQHIQMILSVTNQQGGTVTGICFNITVMPVDNLAPEVILSSLAVREGEESPLGSEHLWLADRDSLEESLRVELRKRPQHGALWLDGFPMAPGQAFTLQHLKTLKVRYRHDNSETVGDDIGFTATDGTNAIDFVLHVDVAPVNDEMPVVMPGLKPELGCAEGQDVIITAEYVYATDTDSDDGGLTYLIARQPYHGVVRKNSVVVDHFHQEDIIAGVITYKHTGNEIGLLPRHDTITFIISDGEVDNHSFCCKNRGDVPSDPKQSLPVYDLKVTVYPVDNQPPSIIPGDVFVVDEGGSAPITVAHLSASDEDTSLEDLVVNLVSPPQFGYIENTLPSPGFEKSNLGISIASFSYRDLLNGHVNYVQSRHQRMEPTADQMMLCVSDGKRDSAHVPFYIIISPTNDEVPEFIARNITVNEGQAKELDPTLINASDLDVPKNELLFSVVQPPRHGAVMSHALGHGAPPAARSAQRRSAAGVVVQDFTMRDLRNGMALMYKHDDTENMEDSFTLQLSDGKHSLQRRVMVRVLPVNDEEPQVIRNTGLEVEAGEARLISSAILLSKDRDTPSPEIMYVFETVPSQGHLQIKTGRDWVTLNAVESCNQETVDMNQLRYLHTGPLGTSSQDFFVFHLLDGKNRSPAQHFLISIKDMEKGNIALFVKPVKVSRGDRVVLTTDVLSATDGSNSPEDLVYTVTRAPSHGHVEDVRTPGLAVHTFSQMDIAANLLGYVHDNRATSPVDTFQFVVTNGKASRTGTVEIAVEMVDRVLPSLSRNGGLNVPQGSSMAVTPDVLALSDPDTSPSHLYFLLTQAPQYGHLLLAGTPLTAESNFTQRDLEELDVVYKHDGGQAQIDRFAFSACDSTDRGFLLEGKVHTEPVFFTIQIKSLDSSAPEIKQLQTLWRAELLPGNRYGIFLTSRELRAQDAHSREEDLTFHILRAPYFGYLENTSTGGFVRQHFSQRDLSRRVIVYVIDPTQEALSDSLEFRVSDPLGNTGPSHTLELGWSRVELSGSEYCVCEGQGSVSLDILRSGNTEESSYVTIKVSEISATSGKDFLLSPSSLIQFDPGVSRRSWQIEVVQDHLEEAEETFDVTLESPEGTVLGHVSKAKITIKDFGKGRCGQTEAPAGPSLGGHEAQDGPYPQHGSIQLETLPLDSLVLETLTRGDGMSQPEPTKSKKRLRATGNRRTIRPSSVHRNGTDTVYTYHGIMSLQVEDETSPSRKGQKVNVQVTSRGQQQPQQAVPNSNHAPVPQIKVISHGKSAQPTGKKSPRGSSSPQPCSPELMGLLLLNQTTRQLTRCNGVSWKPWAPTDEMVSAQSCPAGWSYHSGHCYFQSAKRRSSWSAAARACRESHRSNLVSVLSKADLDWLWDFSGRKPFWIGLHDRERRGRWEWVGGEPVSYTNWRKTPPRSKKKSSKKCVLVWKRAKWQIRDCETGRAHHYMCYTKL
ncbi:FRAS1-related extracellular matrix protein 1a isoform X3 [Hypomesus transpacificus]|nr:FRAS1-related extracellular matrix protein 1a isoform X3 [Hypomesus transpacificus]